MKEINLIQMNQRIELMIPAEDGGKKLHRFLRQALPGLPLSGVYKIIRVGRVKVNGRKAKQETLLNAGDQLTLFMSEQDYLELKKSKPKYQGIATALDIIFEDDSLLVVNKPVGLLTHPDAKEQKDTLVNRVLAYLYHKGELAEERTFLPAPVNRLDRNTSGIVVIGKDQRTLREMTEVLRERQLIKLYLGVVWGAWKGSGEIRAKLEKREQSDGTVRMAISSSATAQSAHTRYRVLGSNGQFSLVELQLVSGRTHQLRAHLQSAGHSLVGDRKYGGPPALGTEHQLLHAYSLSLPDGTKWQAPPPATFLAALRQAGLFEFFQEFIPGQSV